MNQHGGYRPGSGGFHRLTPERTAAKRDFEQERARLEGLKADEKEIDLAIKRGEYLPRAAQQQAAATALAVLTQSLRSIPDNIERTLGVDPSVVESIAQQVDAALAECAVAFKAMA